MKSKLDAKDYFLHPGGVARWWHPEKSPMDLIYARERDLILQLLESWHPRDILEVSCGYGRLTTVLPQTDCLLAVDISEEMLRIARVSARGAVFLQGDAELLPISSESFDCVICMKSLVHYPDPCAALCEMNRVLRPGGILIVDVDNSRSTRRLLKKAIATANRLIDKRFQPVGAGIFWPYSDGVFGRMLRNVGFTVERLWYQGVLVPIRVELPFGMHIQIVPAALSRRLAWVDQFLEKLPVVQKTAVYIIALALKG